MVTHHAFALPLQRTARPAQQQRPATYDLFLSYHAPDRPAARELVALLKQAGFAPWFDQDEIMTGQLWMDRVETGLRQARAVVVLIGPRGIGPWQRHEANMALRLALRGGDERPIIPVLLPGADRHGLPLLLDSFSWVEFPHGFADPQAMARLVAGLRRMEQ